MTIGDYPKQITKDVTFVVVDCSSTYNAILGHLIPNLWKAVTLTYQRIIKFPIEYRVGKIQKDQVAVCECYIVMLEMDNHLQTMCIEEQRTVVEPMEGLEEVLLDESRHK